MKRVISAMAASLLAAIATFTIPGPASAADKLRDDQWHLKFLDVASAHKVSQGEGITVAVIDSGTDGEHPDLTGNVLPGMDLISQGNGWGDTNGHGTGMGGLIAAHGHGPGNADGALGLAPKAKILPFRINMDLGADTGPSVATAVREAVKRGAKIISLSVSTSSTAYDPIQEAIKAGVIVVASAGNRPDDQHVGSPASYPGVVAVGAVGRDGNVADVSVRGRELVLMAPGVDIYSTSREKKYRVGTGTSPSAALVAGAAALVWSKHPELTNQQIVEHLTATSTDKGAAGRDNDYGFGVINPVKALSTTPTVTTSAPDDISHKIPTHLTSKQASAETEGTGVPAWLLIAGAVLLVAAILIGVLLARRRRT